jgi:hypothetical protein
MRFVISTDTIAVGIDGDTQKRVAVMIPAGSEVLAADAVPAEPVADDSRRIDVTWNGRQVTLFLVDLQARGQLVRATGS